jgi:hypothetical protein
LAPKVLLTQSGSVQTPCRAPCKVPDSCRARRAGLLHVRPQRNYPAWHRSNHHLVLISPQRTAELPDAHHPRIGRRIVEEGPGSHRLEGEVEPCLQRSEGLSPSSPTLKAFFTRNLTGTMGCRAQVSGVPLAPYSHSLRRSSRGRAECGADRRSRLREYRQAVHEIFTPPPESDSWPSKLNSRSLRSDSSS